MMKNYTTLFFEKDQKKFFFTDSIIGHKTIVLIHGFCLDHSIWFPVINNLLKKKEVRVIAIDLPGFGQSDDIVNPSIPEYTLIIKDFLNYLKINNAILIGHSLGGYVALEFLSRFPNQVEGLCLLHSSPLPDDEVIKKTRLNGVNFIETHGVDLYIEMLLPRLFSESFINDNELMFYNLLESGFKLKAQTLTSILKSVHDRPDYGKLLLEVDTLLYFILGETDQKFSLEKVVDIIKNRKNTYADEIPNGGHMEMLENPELVVESIITFLHKL